MATRRTILSFKHRYVKAIRWASDRIIQEGEGVIAFVTNNSFIDQIAFDGMRKNLESNFDEIYILDLGGNIRKNPKLSGTTHNVFGIQVGVSINLFVRRGDQKTRTSKIYYTSVEEYYRKEQKYQYLEEFKQRSEVNWEVIQPNQNHTWLTEGLQNEFEAFIPVGNKATKEGSVTSAIFKNYSRGAETARDDWAYNYDKNYLIQNIQLFINTYNEQLYKWNTQRKFGEDIDSFVLYDDKKIKWSSRLKECLAANILIKFDNQKIRNSLYRPFALQNLYFDEVLTHRRGQFPVIFPTVSTEKENRVICVVNEAQIPFSAQIAACIPCLHYGGRQTQCLPFYTYDEDGTNRRENITDWALEEFRTQYQDKTIAKWDIFHYVYAVLPHQHYRFSQRRTSPLSSLPPLNPAIKVARQ